MNKGEFVKILAKKMDISISKADKALKSVFEAIGEAMAKEDKLVFVRFGTFKAFIAKAKDITTPTGQNVHIPERRVVKFTSGAMLKKVLNKNGIRD